MNNIAVFTRSISNDLVLHFHGAPYYEARRVGEDFVLELSEQKIARATVKKRDILSAGLIAAMCSSALLITHLIVNLNYAWRDGDPLERWVFFSVIGSSGLLLIGLKSRGPLVVSFVTLFFVGWLDGPWLFKLLPAWIAPGLFDLVPRNPDSDSRVHAHLDTIVRL